MRKIILALILVLCLSSFASAYQWSLEGRLFGGSIFPQGEEWKYLYEDTDLGGIGFSVQSELIYGVGPYFAYSQSRADTRYYNYIDLHYISNDLAFGLQYRYLSFGWVDLGLRAGGLYTIDSFTMTDGYTTIDTWSDSFGFESALDFNFYPFFKVNNPVKGLGLFVAAVYQYRPLEGMGDFDEASGFGYWLGIQFKYDFGKASAAKTPEKAPAPAPAAPPAPEPEPAPAVQPVPVPEPR